MPGTRGTRSISAPALVQTAALFINQGVKVRLDYLTRPNLTYPDLTYLSQLNPGLGLWSWQVSFKRLI